VFIVYAIVVFRRKPGDEEDGPHIHGHSGLEIVWTILPLITVIAVGVWAATVLTQITEARPNEMTVKVTGQQWAWSFSYPDYEDIGETNQLVLPVNQPIVLEMESRDVIHSFWVPEFRVKQDLLPGQITELRFTPTVEGEYKVRCAEICGFNHSGMLAAVTVVGEAEFTDWVAEQSVSLANLSPVERGELWVNQFGCVGCHSTDGSVMAGPTWQNLFGREELLEDGTTVTIDEAYMMKSILEPGAQIVNGFQNLMPANFGDQFTEKEAEMQNEGLEIDILSDIIAYLESLHE
jgi:cytochrome c oxidase subunit 2